MLTQVTTPSPPTSGLSAHSATPLPLAKIFSPRFLEFMEDNAGPDINDIIHTWDDAGLNEESAASLVTRYARDIWSIKTNTADFLRRGVKIRDIGVQHLQSRRAVIELFQVKRSKRLFF